MIGYKIIIYLSATSVLVPIVIGIGNFRARPAFFKWLGFYLLLSGLSDLCALINPNIAPITNNIFSVFQILILTLFYTYLSTNKFVGKLILGIGVALTLYIIKFQLIGNFDVRNMQIQLLSALWFIVLAINLFFALLKAPPVNDILRYPYFWFNLAILIYFSGNLFLYVSINFIKSENLYYLYIPIHSMFNVIKNLFLARSLYLDPNVQQ